MKSLENKSPVKSPNWENKLKKPANLNSASFFEHQKVIIINKNEII